MTYTFLDYLNPPQHAAVTLPKQSALILAGAGSGKTRVLTTRIAWLLQTGQAVPEQILAVTFTNKAAQEMLLRIHGLVAVNPRQLWVGTFHGLCHRLLRLHWKSAGLSSTFQIMDSGDQLALIKRLCKAQGINEEQYPPKKLQYFINQAKEQGWRPNAIEAKDSFTQRNTSWYADYEAICQKEGVVDFAELLLRTVELLSEQVSLREHYQQRFQHILVDEFQDTNALQYRWLQLMTGKDAALFAVGDDDQSIYAFRGAQVENMNRLQHDFGPLEVIKLEQNYRSYGHILQAANALIHHNQHRLGKNLWTESGEGEPLKVYSASSDGEEAAFVVDCIDSLVHNGTDLNDVAVLYRSNAQSRILEHALFNAGITYRVYGGLRFFERAEIKHALAYLRLVQNPEDDGAFLRVINFPARGIGARSLEQLQTKAHGSGLSLWQVAASSDLSGKAGSALASFMALIQQQQSLAQNAPLPDLIKSVVEKSGLVAYYQQEKDGEERVNNLYELITAAEGFLQENNAWESLPSQNAEQEELSPLTGFLTHAALESRETQAGEGQSALHLMTIHAAKGLEFDTVFITGLEEGLFPHDHAREEPGGMEEERRLMYVAITRAKRLLYLTAAQTRNLHGQFRYNLTSRFLEEIPAEVCQWLSPKPSYGSAARVSGYSMGWGMARETETGMPRFLPSTPGRQQNYSSSEASSQEICSTPSSPFRVGQTVRHSKFGAGVIIAAEGAADIRVQVRFQRFGLKWLSLQYANLELA